MSEEMIKETEEKKDAQEAQDVQAQAEVEPVIERTEDEIDREQMKGAIEAVLFSMGEAVEKRYYLEARRIRP